MRTYDKFYINGQWAEPIGKGRSEVINPATGEVSAVVPYGNAEDADAAPPLSTFEVGPIRPPNEAFSLLVRVTRNCPFNRCSFCPVYKGAKFSLRKADEVIADIRAMAAWAARISERAEQAGGLSDAVVMELSRDEPSADAVQVARFLASGGRTAFLQDANSLIMPVDGLCQVLTTLPDKLGFLLSSRS